MLKPFGFCLHIANIFADIFPIKKSVILDPDPGGQLITDLTRSGTLYNSITMNK
jgi:hypothetical protein